MRVAVIGAGPSGLVALKTLLAASTAENPISAQLFEAEDGIGGTFKYRACEFCGMSMSLSSFHQTPKTCQNSIYLLPPLNLQTKTPN